MRSTSELLVVGMSSGLSLKQNTTKHIHNPHVLSLQVLPDLVLIISHSIGSERVAQSQLGIWDTLHTTRLPCVFCIVHRVAVTKKKRLSKDKGTMRIGDFVSTPYGEAKLTLYRETDKTYVLRLPFGILYANKETISAVQEEKEAKDALVRAKKATELGEAYASLETMRKFNLEVACQECGIQHVDYEECTACLLEGAVAARAASMSGRFSSMFKPSDSMPRLKRFVEEREKKSKPDRCLTCGAPCCAKHSSATFRREGITVCSECEGVFQMDFIVDCMTLNKKERQAKVDKLIDLYDRAVLLLKFSAQYIDEVADSLEDTKKRHNHLNVGGSSAGIVSGVLGVAAAVTILTPAGAPLLLASLMLGTGATAVQTGTEVNSRYFSEPNKVADRIMATHGMLLSVLTVTGTLRDAATRDHIRTDAFEDDSPILRELQKNHIKNRQALLAGMTAGRFSLASAELLGLAEGATIARGARLFSRSGTAAMRTLRFARFAGGALAAATLLVEAKGMHNTVEAIRAGSPCEKAEALRHIQLEMPDLPTTADLEKECTAYLNYMDNRGRQMKEEEAIQLLLEVSEAAQKEQEQREKEEKEREAAAAREEEQRRSEEGQEREGELIVEGESSVTDATESVASKESSRSMGASLLERIQRHKQTQQ